MKAYIRSDNASAYFARQVLAVNPEAETPGKEELPHEHLGLRVLRADPRHDRGALLFGVDVRHGGTSRSVNQRALEARVAGDARPRPAGTAPPLQFYESRPARLPAAAPPSERTPGRQPARAPSPPPDPSKTRNPRRLTGSGGSFFRRPSSRSSSSSWGFLHRSFSSSPHSASSSSSSAQRPWAACSARASSASSRLRYSQRASSSRSVSSQCW